MTNSTIKPPLSTYSQKNQSNDYLSQPTFELPLLFQHTIIVIDNIMVEEIEVEKEEVTEIIEEVIAEAEV
jgi:hypothetical protein